MLLVVGLGNPGKEYKYNRHNIGFMVIDDIVRRYSFSSFRSKFQGEIANGTIEGDKILALKPATFMNESGRSVQAVTDFYKIPPTNVIVIHDEIDLAGGKVRLKIGGGHAGHNGLRSIHTHAGSEFLRIRIGVGHPGDKTKVVGHVLNDFSMSEREWVDKVIHSIGKYLPILVSRDYSMFKSKVASIFNEARLNTSLSGVVHGERKQEEKKAN